MSVSSPQRLLTLALALASLLLARGARGYTGFDCGQGNAILSLSGHSQCGHSSQLVCYQTLGMKVKACNVKLWPHRPQKQPMRPCSGVSMHGNVTDVNRAQGTLVGPVHTAARATVPATLEFNRRAESMRLLLGSCVLYFDVHEASDAALRPVPGEDTGGVSSLLALLFPVVLVPCIVVGLIVAAGSISAQQIASTACDEGHLLETCSAGQYTQIPSEPACEISRHVMVAPASHKWRFLAHSFNFKAMSRRARARRLRRSTRVVYVGPSELSLQQQQLYATGRLQPSPQYLVAPCFRFPPVAVPPGLPAIPEISTPPGSSAAASRSSSCHDITAFVDVTGEATGQSAAPTAMSWSERAGDVLERWHVPSHTSSDVV